jgi:hypothetical protein
VGDIGPEVQHFDVLPVGQAAPEPVPAPDSQPVTELPGAE